ncbi:MAG TPA: right-handed parallel beta-helix repeat-containing protein [Tepidisphaeraceae bacterium]|nr:right-handed parallel beta-helix repeat-containing protein [Tepidisphaeraceae bacterium]
MLKANYLYDMNGPAYVRTISDPAILAQPVVGQYVKGDIATFTDSALGTIPADYVAQVNWGYGLGLENCTVTQVGSVFEVSEATSAQPMSNNGQLMNLVIGYAVNSKYASRPGSLSRPIDLVSITNLVASAAGPTSVNLTWSNPSPVTGVTFNVDRSIDGITYQPVPNATGLPSTTASFLDTSLSGSATPTHYWYRVQEMDSFGPSPIVDIAEAWTPPTVVASGPAVATVISANEIDLALPSGATTTVNITRSPDGVNYGSLASVPAATVTYADTTVTGGTQYWYQVASGSPPTMTASAMAWSLPAAPSDLSAAAGTGNQVQLSWTNNAGGATANDVSRSTDGGVTYFPLDTVDASATTYTDTTAQAGQTYYYQVSAAMPNAGSSSPSNAASFSTSPAGVSSLTATEASSSEIDLGWTNDTASGANGIDALYSTDEINYTLLTSTPLAPTATTYAATGLLPDTHYWFQVETLGTASNTGLATADSATPASIASGLQATANGPYEIDLSWSGSNDSAVSYDVERAPTGSGNFAVISSVNAPSFQDESVSPGTTYDYQIVSLGTGVINPADVQSNVATVATPAGSALPPPVTWYVATTGSDTGNTGLSDQSPFLTINKAAQSANPGDTVLIDTGQYHETVTPAHSGIGGAPITFRANGSDVVSIRGTYLVPDSSWTLNGGGVYTSSIASTPDLSASTDAPVLGSSTITATDQVFANSQMIPAPRYPYSNAPAVNDASSTLLTIPTQTDADTFNYGNIYSDVVTTSGSSKTYQFALVSSAFVVNLANDPVLNAIVTSLGGASPLNPSVLLGSLIHIVPGRAQESAKGNYWGQWVGETATITAVSQDINNPNLVTFTYTPAPGSSYAQPFTVTALATAAIGPLTMYNTVQYGAEAGDRYYFSNIKGVAPTTAFAAESQPAWIVNTNSNPSQIDDSIPTTIPTDYQLHLYSPAGAPSKVEVKVRDAGFDLSGKSYITIEGIDLFAATIVTNDASSHDTINQISAEFLSHYDRTGQPNPALFGVTPANAPAIVADLGRKTVDSALRADFASAGITLGGGARAQGFPNPVNEWLVIDGNWRYLVVQAPDKSLSVGRTVAVASYRAASGSTTVTTENIPNGWNGELISGIELLGPNDTLSNSDIAYCAGNGVTVGSATDIVTGNTIHDVDYMASDNAAVSDNYHDAAGGSIDHNTMYNAGRSIIVTRGGYTSNGALLALNVKIEYNELYDGGLRCDDAGGTYTENTNGGTSRIDYNDVHDIHGNASVGIYLDNGATNFQVDHNVVYNVESALRMRFIRLMRR